MSEAAAAAQVGALHLSSEHCLALCHALPRAADFDTAMRIVEGVRHSLLGAGLLTVNVDMSQTAAGSNAATSETIELQRVWTSDPVAYPVAGRKRKSMTPWTQQLLRRAEIFIGEGEEALAQVFDDHSLISRLGLRAVVNVPMLDGAGRCFATFNALGPRAHWLPAEVLALRLLATLATPAVLRESRKGIA